MSDDESSDKYAERARACFDLFEAGVAMMRAKIRRDAPSLDDEEVERRIARWLLERPGAEHGDAEGRPGRWPRDTAA